MKFLLGLAPLLLFAVHSVIAQPLLVADGHPRAEIVIAEKPARMASLAAEELQTYVKKISGATLPIVTAETGGGRIPIYVGKSAATEKLKVGGDELRHGAFRMVSGEGWMALVGRDRDYTPREPWPHNNRDLERVRREWDAITGETWEMDLNLRQTFKMQNKELGVWEQDERGSLNAVHEFLRGLGVRWYLPGDIGEVVPKQASITLPKVDRTVTPDFPLRYPYQYGKRFAGKTEEMMWQLRLGLNQAPDLIGPGYVAHGTNNVHAREEVKQAHPEYYTLIDGKRDTTESGKPCLSSPGLREQNVKYVRAMFDKLDIPVVSVMPADGYVGMCQCDLCKGKETPERGSFGRFSDYVWSYVDAVGRELLKTHPDRKIICLAYGASVLPPTKIEKLSPNIIVCIAQQRASFYEKERRDWMDELRRSWLAKLPAGGLSLCNYEYYLHPRQERAYAFLPVYFPHAIAEDLRSLKGISMGDYMEFYREAGLEAFGVNALNLYVTSRLWWDANQDVDAMIDEYCRDLYGPASEEMKAFIAYSEGHWMGMNQSTDQISEAFVLLGKAQQKVAADSWPGKRIALVADYIQPLLARREQLLRVAGRENARVLRINDKDGSLITLDGKLDEPLWKKMSGYQTGELVDCTTGKVTRARTRFNVFWSENALYFGIRCDDPDMKHVQSAGSKNDDPRILEGDSLQLLFETQNHAFYQLAVNPAGLVLDVDHDGEAKPTWSSGAKVATFAGDGFWSIEVRLPVGGDLQDAVDALNGVSGRKPAATYPWYFNVCRQRVRNDVVERSALSPTAKTDFLDPQKFARLNGYAPPANWEKEKQRRAEAQATPEAN
ncbi:MAG: DUF4838 domain-containing protein [Roseimicrobium sp.]